VTFGRVSAQYALAARRACLVRMRFASANETGVELGYRRFDDERWPDALTGA
jgi:hypothetical protein